MPVQVDGEGRTQPHRRLATARLLPAGGRLDTQSTTGGETGSTDVQPRLHWSSLRAM